MKTHFFFEYRNVRRTSGIKEKPVNLVRIEKDVKIARYRVFLVVIFFEVDRRKYREAKVKGTISASLVTVEELTT